MATGLSPFVERPRIERHRRRFSFYGLALVVFFLLALIGLAAILILILGLDHAHVVTEHFRIH